MKNSLTPLVSAAATTAVVFLGTATAALAATISNSIDVLWYGSPNPTYNATISELAQQASSFDPASDGSLEWNLTIWNPSDAAPNFSDYDVFVVGTQYNLFGLNFSGILENKDAISEARGDRTFLSGQDADLHYIINIGPRPNGPLGFLVNAVNWAASGTGMGIVSLPDGVDNRGQPTSQRWWLHEDSFLKDELEGYVSYFQEDFVVIPPTTSDFPVNEGLTTAGLSNWSRSSHAAFDNNIPGYLSINDADNHPGFAVTIVTATEADGCTTNCNSDVQKVPESSSRLGLLLLAVGSVGSLVKHKWQLNAFSSTLQAD